MIRKLLKRLGMKGLAGGLAAVAIITLATCSPIPTVNAQNAGSIPALYNPPSQQIAAASGNTSQALFGGVAPYSTCKVAITGTWSGTISFAISGTDNSTFVPIKGSDDQGVSSGTTTTSNVTWNFACAGSNTFKVYFSSYASGSANIQLTGSIGSAGAAGGSGGSAGGATPIPYPTSTAGVLLVQCANANSFQGACPTPIPTLAPTAAPTGATGGDQLANWPYTINLPACYEYAATPAPSTGKLQTQACDATGNPYVDIVPGATVTITGGYIGYTPQAALVLTSASTQTCTAISTTAGLVNDISNESTSAQTATLTLYDDNGTCSAGDGLYAIILGPSQVVTFGSGKFFHTALSYKLSAAAVSNISIGYAK